MSIINLLCVFLILVALYPIIWKRLIASRRVKLVLEIEQKRKSRVITLIHREDTMSILGFPISSNVDIEEPEEILRALEATPTEKPIDIILHVPDGLAISAQQIALAIRKRKGKVTAFIPHYSKSESVLIAMAADEIIMCRNAVLAPLNPKINGFPAYSLMNLLKKKDINHIQDETLLLADMAEKEILRIRNVVECLLTDKFDAERAKSMAVVLTEEKLMHEKILTAEALKDLGFAVSTGLPPEFVELMSLYKQPVLGKESEKSFNMTKEREKV